MSNEGKANVNHINYIKVNNYGDCVFVVLSVYTD